MSAGTRPLLPSARELFPILRERLLASRPVIGFKYRIFPGGPWKTVELSEKGITSVQRKGGAELIYGKPTFRNVLDEKGELV
jgi:hypothetical protein